MTHTAVITQQFQSSAEPLSLVLSSTLALLRRKLQHLLAAVKNSEWRLGFELRYNSTEGNSAFRDIDDQIEHLNSDLLE